LAFIFWVRVGSINTIFPLIFTQDLADWLKKVLAIYFTQDFSFPSRLMSTPSKKSRHAPSPTSDGSPPKKARGEADVCDVCAEQDSEFKQLFRCAQCRTPVHAECYGNPLGYLHILIAVPNIFILI
jgi:hypothetical protein